MDHSQTPAKWRTVGISDAFSRHSAQSPVTCTMPYETAAGLRGCGSSRWTWHDELADLTARSGTELITVMRDFSLLPGFNTESMHPVLREKKIERQRFFNTRTPSSWKSLSKDIAEAAHHLISLRISLINT